MICNTKTYTLTKNDINAGIFESDNHQIYIRITCPCVLYPLTPHFYIVKLGLQRYTSFSIFCSKTYIVGTCLNRLDEAVLTCTHNICFEQILEKSQNNSTDNCHFYSRKNLCILHVRVFVMNWQCKSPFIKLLNIIFLEVDSDCDYYK